jgi:hypothetical protein
MQQKTKFPIPFFNYFLHNLVENRLRIPDWAGFIHIFDGKFRPGTAGNGKIASKTGISKTWGPNRKNNYLPFSQH